MFHLRTLPRPLLRLTLQQLGSAQSRPFSSATRLLSLPPRQPTPAPAVSPPSHIAPTPLWAARIHRSARWIHPYLSLARMDKPIGTWLLYWPCGESGSGIGMESGELTQIEPTSMVHHDGCLCLGYASQRVPLESRAVRDRSARDEGCRLHDQRHVGS